MGSILALYLSIRVERNSEKAVRCLSPFNLNYFPRTREIREGLPRTGEPLKHFEPGSRIIQKAPPLKAAVSCFLRRCLVDDVPTKCATFYPTNELMAGRFKSRHIAPHFPMYEIALKCL